ncbi:hypothetical protein P4N68_00165 [Corynebacterium felinum]|uniref:Uncharacterized protein n=1 Tax=Corynebacterium felinum TaxID=131318 RepID=A0ABU2BAI9_9CORY|nr:hypothetical protein [Corynebacterium felinum]MDF5819498.1 hypothetical protein [Corynebacterium felinum]MDR7355630.1 hypothetical protein [Corynebacterium felinum]WJY94982.1 hypothetical protein CFELI_06830 [Corynebacterium felinum]
MSGLFSSTFVVDELASIFRNVDDPVGAAVEWAKKTLNEAGVNPEQNPFAATKTLRDQEPALSLRAATYIMKKLPKAPSTAH